MKQWCGQEAQATGINRLQKETVQYEAWQPWLTWTGWESTPDLSLKSLHIILKPKKSHVERDTTIFRLETVLLGVSL